MATKPTYAMTTNLPTASTVKGVGPATVKTITGKYGKTITAIQAGDTAGWLLADALVSEVAPGMDEARKADYEALVEDLGKLGIDPGGWNHLRQMRRLGRYWPAHKRFPLPVTVSAHRYAMDDELGIDGSIEVIQTLIDQEGKATATAVRVEVQRRKGNAAKADAIEAKPTKNRVTKSTDTSVDDGSTGLSNGDAIARAIGQNRALSVEVLADAANADLELLRKTAANLIGRIDKVMNARETAEARASVKPTKVGATKPDAKPVTKPAKAGMRG